MTENGENQWRRGLYRSRSGMILGVCRGVANYLDFSVFWIRVLVVLVTFFTMGVALYIGAALLMKPEPVVPFETRSDREFYESYVSSRPLAIDRLKSVYERLEGRIRRMESIVTSKEFQWRHKMNK